MKRSRMNPGKPLVRKTEMPRGTSQLKRMPIQSRGPVGDASPDGSTTKPNGPTKRKKPTRPTRTRAEQDARDDTRARSGGVCERCRRRRAREWHHRRNRSQGGGWSTANGVDLCSACHRHIGAEPDESYALGWLVPNGETAEDWPVRRWTPDGPRWQQPGDIWVDAVPHDRQVEMLKEAA